MGNPIIEMFQQRQKAKQTGPLSGAENYVASHGGDGKTAFMQLCRENGVNMPNVNSPEEAFEVLKKQMNIGNVIKQLIGGGR